jgi:hypothetical protein
MGGWCGGWQCSRRVLHDEGMVRGSPGDKMEDGTALATCSLRRGSDGGTTTAHDGSGGRPTEPTAPTAASVIGEAPRPIG